MPAPLQKPFTWAVRKKLHEHPPTVTPAAWSRNTWEQQVMQGSDSVHLSRSWEHCWLQHLPSGHLQPGISMSIMSRHVPSNRVEPSEEEELAATCDLSASALAQNVLREENSLPQFGRAAQTCLGQITWEHQKGRCWCARSASTLHDKLLSTAHGFGARPQVPVERPSAGLLAQGCHGAMPEVYHSRRSKQKRKPEVRERRKRQS